MPAWLLIVNGVLGEGLELLRQLEFLGHRSTLTAGPRAALELLGEQSYDLVLVDARMLEAGGRDLLGSRTPVVVTHAPQGSHAVCDWLEAGAADYLPPGACLPLLGARIDAALAARLGRELDADQRRQVDRLLAAATAARGCDALSPDPSARAWAGLAGAFLSLAAENHRLRALVAPAPAPRRPG